MIDVRSLIFAKGYGKIVEGLRFVLFRKNGIEN